MNGCTASSSARRRVQRRTPCAASNGSSTPSAGATMRSDPTKASAIRCRHRSGSRRRTPIPSGSFRRSIPTIWRSVVSATAALSACTPRNPFSAMPSVTSTSGSRRLQTGSGTSCTIELCSGGSTREPISLPASENVRKRCSRTSVNDQPVRSLAERRLTRRRAAALLGLSERQVRRLYRAFRRDGAKALASRHRGRPSNRQLATATREQALTLVRERYADFGPTFAHQKLTEQHGLAFSVETLRGWMTAVGLWVPRAQRLRRSQPPRPRRACLGELVQIDGSEHAWFENRGPVCTLLVYVDDAASRLMELAFAAVESTFDYFRATRRYLGAPRKADGLLQRSTQRLSCPRPRARSERPWALTIP